MHIHYYYSIVLITNRKSHLGFRLVPKSVTLNDLERITRYTLNGITRYSTEFSSFREQLCKSG